MTKLEFGERIGKTAGLRMGASALIFDGQGAKILLTRRADNGAWCLPGGGMDAGESIAETCIREVREEIGVEVEILHFVGIYSTPHRVAVYPGGERCQFVSAHFLVCIVSGEPGLSDEVTEVGYFTPAEIQNMELMEHHHERIADTLAGQHAAFVR